MDETRLQEALGPFMMDSDLVTSDANTDGGLDPLFPRLLRAAMNQLADGPAAVSRYAIWANTVRDNIVAALDADEEVERRRLLIRAANSLAAFAEIQSLFDSERG